MSSISLLLLTAFAAGCDEPLVADADGDKAGRPCVMDTECGPELLCVDGRCGLPADRCDADEDCAANQHCNVACVDNASCAKDADCPLDQVCDDGMCTRIGPCTTDDDCPPDAHCQGARCERNDPCAGDEDCPADQRCADGTCVDRPRCDAHADCADEEQCLAGVCQPLPTCTVDDDCPPLAECMADGNCGRRGDCATDDDCRDTERCDDGACVGRGSCSTVDDCADGDACLDGLCTEAVCARDSECDDGLFCNGVETCAPQTGCVEGAPPATAGLSACAREACDEASDALVVTLDHAQCADTNVCTADVCDAALGCQHPADPTAVPAQAADNDCVRAACVGTTLTTLAADTEVPPQGPSTDCRRQVCSAGTATSIADDSEVPPQGPANDCRREICQSGAPASVANDAELPPQGPANDCRREVCQGGAPTSVANDAEVPPTDGSACKDARCLAGAPSYTPNDARCDDTLACTVGTCLQNGTCQNVPDDALCACPGTALGFCMPGDPRAVSGCVCLTPAALSCSAAPVVGQVLEQFTLTATAAGAAPGSTFTWQLVGTPAGADPAEQLLVNATSSQARFVATAPSAPGVADYALRVTLEEPDLPPQSCTVFVEARPPPDALEVSLSMDAPLDVDLHVIGGPGSSMFDFPFHRLHDPLLFGDDPDRDCHWANCPVCTVDIPGQSCTPVSPRIVDFDNPNDGASLADKQDPQLDIDNRRGCFTDAATGAATCVPERVTVETPAAGDYVIYAYLYGDALSATLGQRTTPTSTTVTVTVKCRGATRSYTRTLSSIESDGTTAASDSDVRHGSAPVAISIPATGACTL